MRATPLTLLTGGLALLLIALACGGAGTEAAVQVTSANEGRRAPVENVELDCDGFVDKIATCADAFEAAYALTEAAGRAGKSSIGGEPDGPAGAKSFMIAFRHEHNRVLGQQLCDSWQSRDNRWKVRLGECSLSASCDDFAACAAPAIGNPRSVP